MNEMMISKKTTNIVDINGVLVGTDAIVIMAGPCSVESEHQILSIAKALKQAGASVLRGGVYKPRTSPYSFQGLGSAGLPLLKTAGDETGLRTITEVMDPRDVELVSRYVDCLQIGSRNMQNYTLLKEVGRTSKPVLLKRGIAASYFEWLNSAEYIWAEGNKNIILCERGIVSLRDGLRYTLDLSAIPYIKSITDSIYRGYPIIVDPSHGTGLADLISPMSKAAIACGADGLLIEVHYNPSESKSDSYQTIDYQQFNGLVSQIKKLAPVVNRTTLV